MQKPTRPKLPTTRIEPEKHYRHHHIYPLRNIFEQNKEYSPEDFLEKLREEINNFTISNKNYLSEEPDIKMGVSESGDWECYCDEVEDEDEEIEQCYNCETGNYDLAIYHNVKNKDYSKKKHDAWTKSRKEYLEVKMPKFEKEMKEYNIQLEEYLKDEAFKKIEKTYKEALEERSKS